MGIEDQIIGVESGGSPTARNPRSSATGAGQFISGTWLDTVARNRPDLAQGRSPEEILALRNDPALSKEMTAAYANANGKILADNGLPVTPGTTYLAHFAGPQGAVNILRADPNAPVSSVMTPAALKANPFLTGMTVGGLKDWASRKMGGGETAPASPPATPMNLAPQAPAQPTGMLSGISGLGRPAQAQQVPQAAPQAMPQQEMAQPGAPMPEPAAPLAMALTSAAKARLFAAMRGQAI